MTNATEQTWRGGPLPLVGVTTVDCFQIGHTYGAHLATDHCLLTDDAGRCFTAIRP